MKRTVCWMPILILISCFTLVQSSIGQSSAKPEETSPPSCPLPSAKPVYTEAAKKAHIEGTISLDVVVAKDGTVDVVKVIQGLGYGLDEEAVKFVANNFKCKPGIVNGKPVGTHAKIDVNFRLL